MDDRPKMRTFIPIVVFYEAMGFDAEEFDEISSLNNHILFGLCKEELIEKEFIYGIPEFIKSYHKDAKDPGVIIEPSILGMQLYLWSHGLGNVDTDHLFSADLKIEPLAEIAIDEGYYSIGRK